MGQTCPHIPAQVPTHTSRKPTCTACPSRLRPVRGHVEEWLILATKVSRAFLIEVLAIFFRRGRAPIRTGSTQQSPDIPRPARRLGPRSALQLIFRSFVMSSAVRLPRSVPYVSPKRDRQEFHLQVVRDVVGSSSSTLRSTRLHKERRKLALHLDLFIMSSAVILPCSVPYTCLRA